MKRIAALLLGVFHLCFFSFAQQNLNNQNSIRQTADPTENSFIQQEPQVQTFRIEGARVWLNGRLIPKQNLPPSLQNFNPNVRVNMSLCCNFPSHSFTLNGIEYLIKDGKITETAPLNNEPVNNANELQQYFNQMKVNSPGTFNSLTKEAQLEMLARDLTMQYFNAKTVKEKQDIEDQLRVVLDEIFTMKQENIRREIQNLQLSISLLQKKIDDREKLRFDIINRRMQELLNKSTPTDW